MKKPQTWRKELSFIRLEQQGSVFMNINMCLKKKQTSPSTRLGIRSEILIVVSVCDCPVAVQELP